MPTTLSRSTDKPAPTLEATGFAYVGRSRCGHVNFLAVEPHQDDRTERVDLVRELRHYITSGGWIDRVARTAIPALDMCSCEHR